MGTTWTVRLDGSVHAEAAQAAIERELALVVGQMSPWEPASDLSRFNTSPADAWITLPSPFLDVLRCALSVSELTGGAFDPTLGALTGLWGFGPDGSAGAPPIAADVESRRASAGWRKLRLDGQHLLQPGGLTLDFCGVAKGYGVDRIARALEALGAAAYLIEVGGELRGRGVKADGLPWWVELEHPGVPGSEAPPLVGLVDMAVATSGGDQRFFDHEGRRYTHTLDPATGEAIDDAVLAVSVFHAECMWADALATALLVMGPDQAMTFAEKRNLAARLVVRTADGLRQTLSPALQAMAD